MTQTTQNEPTVDIGVGTVKLDELILALQEIKDNTRDIQTCVEQELNKPEYIQAITDTIHGRDTANVEVTDRTVKETAERILRRVSVKRDMTNYFIDQLRTDPRLCQDILDTAVSNLTSFTSFGSLITHLTSFRVEPSRRNDISTNTATATEEQQRSFETDPHLDYDYSWLSNSNNFYTINTPYT